MSDSKLLGVFFGSYVSRAARATRPRLQAIAEAAFHRPS